MPSQNASGIHTTPTQNTELAALLKAAGDPLRLEILRLLGRDSLGVMELSRIFNVKQSGMSHHLKVLASANLVLSRREGNSIFYRRALTLESNHSFVTALFHSIDQIAVSEATVKGLNEAQADRAQASREFFTHNSEKFREQQDLIASYPAYADTVLDMLNSTVFQRRGTALEIGPGEGEFLLPLAKRFDQVIGLDNSVTMLEKAKEFSEKNKLNNVSFLHGDTHSAMTHNVEADCIVLNMVLHHTPSPASILQDSSKMLKAGGALLITDLCHHDQQWAMEACGDLWLGFEPDDLTQWSRLAGLNEGQSQYIALRNGFQIQVRQFFSPLEKTLTGEFTQQEQPAHV